MNKNLKTVKTGMILGLVLISMFAVFVPSASAGFIPVDASLIIVPNLNILSFILKIPFL